VPADPRADDGDPTPDDEDGLHTEIAALRARLGRETRARRSRQELANLAARATSADSALDVGRALANGSAEVVGAALCVVGLPEGDMVRLLHSDSVPEAVRADWQRVPRDTPVPIVAALADGSDWIELMDSDAMAAWPVLATEAERLGVSAVVVIPLRPAGRPDPLGTLTVGFAAPGPLGDFERELLSELCDVGTSALRQVESLEDARRSTETLQRSLLPPRLPALPGLETIAFYEPGSERSRVGGDWYDLFALDDGSAAMVIGDVAGHDLRAAATMGQVRHVLASHLLHLGDPALALSRTDQYFCRIDESVLATAFVAVVDPDRSTIRYATAGHPAPLHGRAQDVTTLPVVPGAPLGTGFGIPEPAERAFGRGEVLVLFTDGLVERRGVPFDRGVDELAAALCERLAEDTVAGEPPLARVAATVSDLLQRDLNDDDIAALVVARSLH
jgi:serine phosphatase RsbU (regulator of sigma subunit)